MLFERSKDERLNVRYVRIIEMCLLAVGLAVVLLMLTGTEDAKAAPTVVSPGPVNDLLYGGPWDTFGSPYWVEGDIFVPNTISPPGSPDNTLTIDGSAGPVEVRFNGSYSFRVGITGNFDPASLVVNGINKNINFTRNGTSGTWQGIEFTDSVSSAIPSRIDNAIIEYTSGGPEVAVWLNGVTNVWVINSEIRTVSGTTNAVGIGLFHGLGILNTDNNFVTGNYIHNISISAPGALSAAGIALEVANANTIVNNEVENIVYGGGGGGGAYGISISNSSYNIIVPNTVRDITSDGNAGVGIILYGASDDNTVTDNEITAISLVPPGIGEAVGIGLIGDIPSGQSPDGNEVRNNTIKQIYSSGIGAYGLAILDGPSGNLVTENDIEDVRNLGGGISSGIHVILNTGNSIENSTVSGVIADGTGDANGIYYYDSMYDFIGNITIDNILSNGSAFGIKKEYSHFTIFHNITVENITSQLMAFGIYVLWGSDNTFDNITIYNVTSLTTGAAGIILNSPMVEKFNNTRISNVVGNGGTTMGFGATDVIQIELVEMTLTGVINKKGDAVGIGLSGFTQDVWVMDSTINDVSANGSLAAGIDIGEMIDGSVLYNNNITNITNTGHSTGIYARNGTNNTIIQKNTIYNVNTTGGKMKGIYLNNSDNLVVEDNIIELSDQPVALNAVAIQASYTKTAVPTRVDATIVRNWLFGPGFATGLGVGPLLRRGAGLLVDPVEGIVIEDNYIVGTEYGIYIYGSSVLIGNNTIYNNSVGIWAMNNSFVVLYNNEIFDNIDWGLRMDMSSSGIWMVDVSAALINNPAQLNGDIYITGRLTFYNVSSTDVGGVVIGSGGIMELGASPASVISQDVWVDGKLYINSSKWEINCINSNGEYGIQVNGTGTMIIQDNGTGSSTVTDSPVDNDGGAGDYRYYFKVLTGATFRLLDSEVSEVGWLTGGFDERALYIQTADAWISHSTILRGFYGIIIQGGGWTFENNEIDDVDKDGMWVEGGSGTVITNNTINTTDTIGYGMLLLDFGHWIENNTIITLGGSGDAISLSGGGNHDMLLNTITTSGNSADGILFASSFNNRVYDNTIQVAGGSAYCMFISSASGNQLQGNTVSGGAGGIFLEVAGSTRIGNNTVANSDSGIVLINSPGVQLYNNEIFDNFFWGIWMDSSSSGNWYVDDYGSLINNPAVLNGSLIITTGKLTFYNVGSSEVRGVAISSGGFMELGASPASLISNNVWVDGVLYINSSKWEIDVSANGTYGIQVNSTGTMIIQDNGTGPSTVTDGPFDTDDRGPNDFRYYFKVLFGSTFRLLGSEVSEVGWQSSPAEESGLYIQTTDAAITDSQIFRNYDGLYVINGQWVIENTTFDMLDRRGINLIVAPSMVIANSTINTTGISGNGIYSTSSHYVEIIGNTIVTTGLSARGIELQGSDNNTIADNTIIDGQFGIYISNSENNTIDNNTIEDCTSRGIYILSSSLFNEITDNILTNNNVGIRVDNSDWNTIADNTVTGGSNEGIYISSSNYNRIKHNTVAGHTLQISLTNSNRNIVEDNTLSGPSHGVYSWSGSLNFISNNTISVWATGVYLTTNSNSNTVFNNTLSNCGAYGIFTQASSNSNKILNNTLTNTNSYAIYLWTTWNSTVMYNTVDGNQNIGIYVLSSTQCTVEDNNVIGNTGNGIQLSSSHNNTIENNDVNGNPFGISISGSNDNVIGNNSIWNNNNGVWITNSMRAIFYNNEIYDNTNWGLWMDDISSAIWFVDDFASLINNPMDLNGDIIIITGKLSLYNISSSIVKGVSIGSSGILELGASPASIISQSVWVEGSLYINSSKWEINVSANSEYGIQVNSTGTFIIQDNGTGPSTITDGPYDNDAGVVGTDNFRYFFKVLAGSTFRLLDSIISESGWDTAFQERGPYIETSDAYVYNSTFMRNNYGVIISGGGWIIENSDIYDVDIIGMWVEGALGTVIMNNTITTTGNSGHGIYVVSSPGNRIYNNTIDVSGTNADGIYLSDSPDNTINDCTISNAISGIRVETSSGTIIGNSTITANDNGILLIGASTATLYNNDIFDNLVWGLLMNSPSSGNWIVDSPATFLNNDGILNGSLTVKLAGDLLITNTRLQTKDVYIQTGGQLKVLDSKSTIISWNLTVDGTTTLDNSSWKINNTYNGEHWINVTSTGTLNVINGSLVSAFNTAYHYDFYVDGTATFTDSTVEYVGYSFDIGSTGIFVTSPNVLFDNMVIRHSMVAIGVEGTSITIQNVEIYNCSVGIALFNGSSQVLDSLDIHDLYGSNFAIGIVAENYTDVTISNVTIYNVSSIGMGVGILMTDGAHNYFMENIDISNVSAFGMFLDNADGMITDTIINDCWVGLQTEQSDVSITNMDITDASLLGMSIQVNSTVEFISGTIIESQGGIRVAYNSIIYVNHTTIENRTINNITNGIFAQEGMAYLYNTTILNQSIGVQGMDGSYVAVYDSLMDSNEDSVVAENQTSMLIVNSSITNGKNLDFLLNQDSHIISLNTTFDNSSVMFTDLQSTLTVQWFLHIKVEGVFAEAVPGANVRVTDNVNGSFDMNFIADSEGRVKWILVTEYIQNQTSTTLFTPFNISAWNLTKQGEISPIISKSMWVVVTLDTDTVTIDYIRLEYFDGTPVAEGTLLSADEEITVYARGYNYTTGLVGDVSANWVVNGGIGGLSSATGPFVTFNATTVGIGNISATYSTYTNVTGNMTITPGAVVDIQIIPSGPESYTADENNTYQVFGYDSDGNLNTTWVPEWNWDGPVVGNFTKVTPEGYSYLIDFNWAGPSLVRVNVSGNPLVFNTSSVTVVPGKVVSIIIIPAGAETNTTDEVLNLTVEGYDADGNLNTTWIPDVNWTGPDLGVITVLGYDVTIEFTTVGTDNINVSDSLNPAVANETKSITVNPGAPYRMLYVSGSGQIGFAGSALAAPFVVLVEDFDGNPVPNVEINWSLDGWPVSASGQMLSDYNSLTDVNGEASTVLTLGNMTGMYYVNATNVTIVLAGEPVTFNASVTAYTIDEIIITDGSGTPITDITLTADDTLTLYAWAYNYTAGMLGQVAVNWSSLGGIGGFITSVVTEPQATFDLTTVGVGNITIDFMNATLTNTTGSITVIPGAVVSIVVTPSTATGSSDDSDAFSAVGYDADGNENWTWTPAWAWDGLILGSLTPVDVYNYTVDYHTVGVENLRVSLSINPTVFGTTSVTVYSGQVVRIELTPWPSTTGTTDDVGAFSVIGYDADDNENWTWTPIWDWAGVGLGILTSIDDYNYTVPYDSIGTDTINVEVSGNPSISNSTDIAVTAGQVVRIEIAPWPTTSDNVGNTGLFSVIGFDADDNENWTWMPVWTWDGSGLGVLLAIDAYNYSVTYDSAGSDVINVNLSSDPAIFNTTSITTTALPTVDYIVIMDAPSGLGNIVTPQNFSVGQSAMFYAAGFNLTSGYVMDIEVTWTSSDNANATVDSGPGNSTTFTANNSHGGTVIVTATNSSLAEPTNSTGTLTVLAPAVDFIQIRDAPANGGSVVQASSYTEDETDTYYAAGFNFTAGYIGDVAVTWESTNTAVGLVSPGSGSSTTFTAGAVSGTTTVTAVYLPGISNDTGALTVSVVAPLLTIDHIEIRDAPGGLGSAVSQISLAAGGQITVYAAGYNASTGEFVDNVSVTWDVTVEAGTLDITSGTSTTFTAIDTTGSQVTGTLEATYSGITVSVNVTVELSPLAPMGLTVSQRPEGGSLRITWSANIENDIEGYVIFRSTTSGADFTELATVSGISNTQYIDTGLTDGTSYYYYIMAFDANQNFSPASAEASGVSDRDTDSDGTFNLQDNDDDGDGLSDTEEATLGTDPLDTDTDGDGHDDLEDKYPLNPDKWRKDEEKEGFPVALLLIPIIVIIVLILLFLLMKKRQGEEEMPSEEDLEDEEEPEELPEDDLEALSEEGYFEDEGEEPPIEDEESWEDEGAPDEGLDQEAGESTNKEEETSWDGEEPVEEEITGEPEGEMDELDMLLAGESATSEGQEESSEAEEESGAEKLEYECPDCGGPISESMEKCPNCGLEFEFEEEE